MMELLKEIDKLLTEVQLGTNGKTDVKINALRKKLKDAINSILYPPWLNILDAKLAQVCYKNNEKVIAVKHLSEIARANNIQDPIHWAKDFLEKTCQ